MVHRFFLHRNIMVLAVLALFCTAITNAQLPKRKMVIEKQTGAWCQYCPGGIEAFENFEKQYPHDGILLAYHGPESYPEQMKIPEQTALGQAGYWNGNFPNACLNREAPYVQIGVNQATAQAASNIQSKMTAIVEVGFKNVDYNTSTRNLKVELEAKFFEKHDGDKRFILIIVEDSVTGSGTGYDQVNAYNTDPSQKRWYQKGNPIKNFYHRHVVRKAVGDIFGAAGSLPKVVQSGETKTYVFNTKIDNAWKPERVHLVAMVAEYYSDPQVSRRILNAEEESLTIRPARAEMTMVEPYNVIKTAQAIEKTITIKNTNSAELTYDVSFDDMNSQNDGNWTVNVTPDNVKIAAGKTAEIKVTVTAENPIDYATFASINIKAVARPKAGFEPRENSVWLYYLSDNAKYPLFFRGGPEKFQDEFISQIQFNETYGYNVVKLPWSLELFNAYKSQFEGITFQISGGYIGTNGNQVTTVYNALPLAANDGSYPNFAKAIIDFVNAGKSVFVTAPRSVWWASSDPNAAAGNVPEAKSLFNDILKVKFSKTSQRYTLVNNSYSVQNFTIAGVEDDPITNGLSATANMGFAYHTMQTDIMELLSGSTSVPIFSSDNNKNNIVGVRYENDKKGRIVFLTVPPEAFDNSYMRGQIVTRSWDWLLEGKIEVPKVAKIAASVNSVDFAEVVVNNTSEKKFDIENTGEIPLIIKSVQLGELNKDAFTFNAPEMPLTIEPGQKREFAVSFKPTAEKVYLTTLQFVSNADGEEDNSFTIDIEGKGVSDAPVPSVLKATVQNVNFGSVAVGTPAESTLKLKNSSAQAVTVSNIKFEGTNAANFSVITKHDLLPANIELPFKLGFTGDKVGNFAATMIVTSTLEDGKEDIFSIEVSASAVASGVQDDAVSQSMAISVGPNPASVQSLVNLTVSNAAPQSVKISVLDMKGSSVMTLFNGTLSNGNYPFSVDAAKLAAGTYRIVARTNGESVSIPFMIVR